MFSSVRIVKKAKPTVTLLGHFKGKSLDATSREFDGTGVVRDALKRGEATGAVGSITEAFDDNGHRFIIVGLGDAKTATVRTFHKAIGAAGRRLAKIKAGSVEIALGGAIAQTKLDDWRAGSAVGEALGLLSWDRSTFKGSATSDTKREKLSLLVGDKSLASGIERGLGLAVSANIARDLSETPPNIATPDFIAKQAQAIARKTGMTCKVFRGTQLEAAKLEGHINVGKASENAPCMVRLEYKPEGSRASSSPVVLVGKTITYDTGGLSLKVPATNMAGMKRDKDGGCNVLGAMHAIATVIKPRKRVVAFLVCAENSVSDEAYRPDDVLTFLNGVTVEITNTDAEGRLVLADGLAYACAKENPSHIIDMATLTGGIVVALGSTYAGMWCEDDALRGKVEEAAAVAGEPVWRMPLNEEYRQQMSSDVADILNSNPNRKAHPIQGAAFLSYFVDEKIPWCHLDIAGVHMVESDSGPYVKNSATAFGVRLLAELMDL